MRLWRTDVAASRKQYKAVLPRLIDYIRDLLDLMSDLREAACIMQLVLDAVDAYWQVPLSPELHCLALTWSPQLPGFCANSASQNKEAEAAHATVTRGVRNGTGGFNSRE